MASLAREAKSDKASHMRILALSTILLALGACQSGSGLGDAFDTRQNAGTCPPAGSIYNASRIVQFDGERQIFPNVEYTGEIVNVRLYCRYASTNPVRAEVEIDFAFGKGPKGDSNRHDYSYWVAVTRRSGKVLHKEHFTVQANFADGPVVGETEVLQQIIIPDRKSTRLNSSHTVISYAVFCLKKKKPHPPPPHPHI